MEEHVVSFWDSFRTCCGVCPPAGDGTDYPRRPPFSSERDKPDSRPSDRASGQPVQVPRRMQDGVGAGEREIQDHPRSRPRVRPGLFPANRNQRPSALELFFQNQPNFPGQEAPNGFRVVGHEGQQIPARLFQGPEGVPPQFNRGRRGVPVQFFVMDGDLPFPPGLLL